MDMRTGEILKLAQADLNNMSRGQRRNLVSLTDEEAAEMAEANRAKRIEWAKVQPRPQPPVTHHKYGEHARFKVRRKQSR